MKFPFISSGLGILLMSISVVVSAAPMGFRLAVSCVEGIVVLWVGGGI